MLGTLLNWGMGLLLAWMTAAGLRLYVAISSARRATRPCVVVRYALLVFLLVTAAGAQVTPSTFSNELTITRLPVRYPRPSYQNYAFDFYQNYPDHTWGVRKVGSQLGIALGVERPRAVIDLMGNYLTTGYDLYTWEERRQPEQRFGSALFKDWSAWQLVFTNLAVASDGYGAWSYHAMVGDGLIARFSPLTLSKTDLYGLRFDLSTPTLKLTGIGSRIARPNRETYSVNENVGEVDVDHSTMLLGARAQFELGYLKLGLNGANLHAYNSVQDNNSIKGLLRRDQPLYSYIIVRVSDDEPDDGLPGAVVQDVRLVINDEVRSELRPVVIRKRAKARPQVGRILTLTGQFIGSAYDHIDGPVRYYQGKEIPLFADFLYRIEHDAGADVSKFTNLPVLVDEFQLQEAGSILRADGADQLIYLFDMRQEPFVESVDVEVVVGNDYKVEWAGVYLNQSNATAARIEDRLRSTIYYDGLRGRGRVTDLSNLARRRFSVGENTSIFTYSADMQLNLPWIELNGEIARSAMYGRYPAHYQQDRPLLDQGDRYRNNGGAYFLNGVHNFRRGLVGFELFAMNPDFTTKMPTFLKKDYGYIASRNYDPLARLANDTVIWSLVQDNEDGDRWPDILVGNVLGSPLGSSDQDGVFPGQDLDNDGIIDTDRNFNGTPDYNETFLLFEVEPSDYVYGLDRNNNNEPDHREDDWEPDYPYDPDQRGFHMFGQLDLYSQWKLGVGSYAAKGLASGGHSRSAYALLTYRRTSLGRLRQVFFENNFRRVKDDIADPFNQYSRAARLSTVDPYNQGFTGGIQSLGGGITERRDDLVYQDSYVNEVYVEADVRPSSNLQLVQKLRTRINWQQPGVTSSGILQRQRRLDSWVTVSRIQYTWRLGNLTVMPQYKLMHLRLIDRNADRIGPGNYASRDLQSVTTKVPILRASYRLLPRTTFQLGLQGVGPLPYRVKDRVRAHESFKQRTLLATVTNRSRYFGYELYTIIGMTKERRQFDSRQQGFNNTDGLLFFVRGLVGFTEYGRML